MKFRTALILLNLHLEELDILFLINKYRHSNDQVNYADFCSNINGVFENQDFQNSLLSKMTHMVLFIEKDAQLAGILDSFRNEIMTRRLTLKPSFQDFDKTNCSKITIDQVLSNMEVHARAEEAGAGAAGAGLPEAGELLR